MSAKSQRLASARACAAFGLVLAAGLLVGNPASALNNNRQMMTGGGVWGGSTPIYTSPGLSNLYSPDTPATGDGETAAQMRMEAGVLRDLKVNLRTSTTPSSGSLTVVVRINGTDTKLKCTLSGKGNCSSSKKVAINKNDRLAIEITNDFVGAGSLSVTYTIVFD